MAVVPFHNKDLRKGTLHAILKDADMSIEELLDLI
jgi:predicted RNA binding protein YcfA (HicA-like mRNA interferase family)